MKMNKKVMEVIFTVLFGLLPTIVVLIFALDYIKDLDEMYELDIVLLENRLEKEFLENYIDMMNEINIELIKKGFYISDDGDLHKYEDIKEDFEETIDYYDIIIVKLDGEELIFDEVTHIEFTNNGFLFVEYGDKYQVSIRLTIDEVESVLIEN